MKYIRWHARVSQTKSKYIYSLSDVKVRKEKPRVNIEL